jgi:hypothetical protein
MKIELIRIKDAAEFIGGNFYRQSVQLPITPRRAASQLMNPFAQPDDPWLILARDARDELLGYLGILPLGTTGDGKRVFGNSCWWTDPEKGKGVAMPLFYRMMECTGGNLIFFELTPHTAALVQQLDEFVMLPVQQGIHGWFRSGLAVRSERNSPVVHRMGLAKPADGFMNTMCNLRLNRWRKESELQAKDVRIVVSERPDVESRAFLNERAEREFLSRSANTLEWVLSYPWLTTDPHETPENASYAFSWKVISREVHCLKMISGSRMTGFALLTIRDGMCRIPLFYTLPAYEAGNALALLHFLPARVAHGLICNHGAILQLIKETSFPFLRSRAVERRVALARSLWTSVPKGWIPQDGDGDGIFT